MNQQRQKMCVRNVLKCVTSFTLALALLFSTMTLTAFSKPDNNESTSQVENTKEGKGNQYGKGNKSTTEIPEKVVDNTSEAEPVIVLDNPEPTSVAEVKEEQANLSSKGHKGEKAVGGEESSEEGAKGHFGKGASGSGTITHEDSDSSDEGATHEDSGSSQKGKGKSDSGSGSSGTSSDTGKGKGSAGSKGGDAPKGSDSEGEEIDIPAEPVEYIVTLPYDVRKVQITEYINVYVNTTLTTELWLATRYGVGPFYGPSPFHDGDIIPRFDETYDLTPTPVEFEGESYDAIDVTFVYPGTLMITGKNPGLAILKIKSGNTIESASVINVAANPVLPDTEVYIAGTTLDPKDVVDEYGSLDEIYITTHNVKAGPYFIKVETKGKTKFSISGNFTITNSVTETFKLSNAIVMDDVVLPPDNNSASYFLSMSTYSGYDKGDEEDGSPKTLADNFKILSPVPSLPIEKIDIQVSQLDGIDGLLDEILYNRNGNTEGQFMGYDILLARELDDKGVYAKISDYYNLNPSTPAKYSDEVKAVGHIQKDGTIAWDPLKETIKIGGYVLIVELPDGYKSNLMEKNPAAEDGEVLAEVHVVRNEPLVRSIVLYRGESILSDESYSLFTEASGSISITDQNLTDEEIASLTWVLENLSKDALTNFIVSEDKKSVTFDGTNPGSAVIKVMNGDRIVDSCFVTVALTTVVPEDEVFVVATKADRTLPIDEFDMVGEIFITAHQLQRYEGITNDSIFYVKLSEQGSGAPIAEGTITLGAMKSDVPEIHYFKLVDVLLPKGFELPPDNFSKSYVVAMSLESNYPTGDDDNGIEQTLKDNFKITSPVPTGSINARIKILDDFGNILPFNSDQIGKGNIFFDQLVGAEVVLAREIDGIGSEATIDDYVDGFFASGYTDEVKMVGEILNDGSISWRTPKESLKIGGYVLLINLKKHFSSNLSGLNPYVDDGGLLKEVHIKRDETVTRDIVIRYHNERMSLEP